MPQPASNAKEPRRPEKAPVGVETAVVPPKNSISDTQCVAFRKTTTPSNTTCCVTEESGASNGL
ncbi:unnamed protein product [Rhodiola kirilowii]